MNVGFEAKIGEGQRDVSMSADLPQTERIIEPLFSYKVGELLPHIQRRVEQLETFLATPTVTTATFAVDACRELVEGMQRMDPLTVKPGRSQMLHSITLATLHQVLSVEPTQENLPYLAYTISGGSTDGEARLDLALTAGISALNESLSIKRLKTLASRGGACDRCSAAFMSLADIVRDAPVQTGQVCKERTEQVRVVAALAEGFSKALPKAREILSYCAHRPALVAGFTEHIERIELILAAGKLGELSRLFPIVARDMVEAKYVIQKQVAEHDERYEVDESFVNTRPGRKARTAVRV